MAWARHPTRAQTSVGALAGSLVAAAVLTSCASPGESASATSTLSSATTDASAAAAQYASDVPPASARMVCGSVVAGQVAGVLGLSSVATPQSTWVDHVYGCDYLVPTGRLTLSVTVAASDTAARDLLQTLRGQLGATVSETGLGLPAYGSDTGAVIAAKDNMLLKVDATGLPEAAGGHGQRRLDVAQLIAAGVLDCWSGS